MKFIAEYLADLASYGYYLSWSLRIYRKNDNFSSEEEVKMVMHACLQHQT
jgi:hypothetical protein